MIEEEKPMTERDVAKALEPLEAQVQNLDKSLKRLENLEADVRRLTQIVDAFSGGTMIYSVDRSSVIVPKRLFI
jgi:prefoldin subunit 5